MCCCSLRLYYISIHALREEGDSTCRISIFIAYNFYPRPPRGGRPITYKELREAIIFLSTPSARRATWAHRCAKWWSKHFYPRPPRGGRLRRVRFIPFFVCISIHALREEGDFLKDHQRRRIKISIHALREEGDEARIKQFLGECIFLSTPSARRATRAANSFAQAEIFLSTPSARRATRIAFGVFPPIQYFYPRPPRGGRHGVPSTSPMKYLFLSTPSSRRATLVLYFFFRHFRHFYPRPPRGGRPACEIVMEFVY